MGLKISNKCETPEISALKRSVAKLPVLVIGTGPAGLMAGTILCQKGIKVVFIDQHSGVGRKLLIAGSSGLNISFSESLESAIKKYRGDLIDWKNIFSQFGANDWLNFIQEQLKLEIFEGSSRRFFVKEMKASGLVKSWVTYLKSLGAEFILGTELTDFHLRSHSYLTTSSTVSSTMHSTASTKGAQAAPQTVPQTVPQVQLTQVMTGESKWIEARAVILALGGASWQSSQRNLKWPSLLRSKQVGVTEFQSSNSGYGVDWSSQFLAEAEGKPFKSIVFESTQGSCPGELMVTKYGLEGTPIYSYGAIGQCYLDLKPGLSLEKLKSRVERVSSAQRKQRENFSPMRRIQKYAGLCEASQALLFHHTTAAEKSNLEVLFAKIKRFPLTLTAKQSLEFAISSAGVVDLNEFTAQFEFKKYKDFFAVGEMLNWDTITGGYWIQGCVSQGYWVGHGLASRIFETA